jgi:hypothetical protein
MFRRLARLWRKPAPYKLDESWISVSMLCLLSEENSVTRAALARILAAQFGHVNFAPFSDAESFVAALSDEFSDGFKALAAIAFVVLATDFPYERIAAALHDMFVLFEKEQLPEFLEAQRRFDEVDAAAIPDPPSGSIVAGSIVAQ